MTRLLALTAILALSGCDQASSSAGSSGATATAQPASIVNPTDTSGTTPTTTQQTSSNDDLTQPFVSPDEPLPSDRQTGAGAQLTFGKTRHEFGDIWPIRTYKASFPFRNTGTETLLIHEIKPSCGCTTPELDKYSYEPGEGGYIRFSFDPKGINKQVKNVKIITNAANGSVKELYISANLLALVGVEPSIYMRFGSVSIDEDHTRVFEVVGQYPEMIVDSVNAPNTMISARAVEDDGVTDIILPTQEGRRHKISVTLHKNGRWGGFYSTVVAKVRIRHPETGEQIPTAVSIHVSANVFGKIHASDTMFRIGATPLKTPFRRSVTLTRPDGQPFIMSGAYLENAVMPGLKLTVEPITQPNISGYRLTISGDPGNYEGRVGGNVLILTDVPGEEQFRIPVNGIVRLMN